MILLYIHIMQWRPNFWCANLKANNTAPYKFIPKFHRSVRTAIKTCYTFLLSVPAIFFANGGSVHLAAVALGNRGMFGRNLILLSELIKKTRFPFSLANIGRNLVSTARNPFYIDISVEVFLDLMRFWVTFSTLRHRKNTRANEMFCNFTVF